MSTPTVGVFWHRISEELQRTLLMAQESGILYCSTDMEVTAKLLTKVYTFKVAVLPYLEANTLLSVNPPKFDCGLLSVEPEHKELWGASALQRSLPYLQLPIFAPPVCIRPLRSEETLLQYQIRATVDRILGPNMAPELILECIAACRRLRDIDATAYVAAFRSE